VSYRGICTYTPMQPLRLDTGLTDSLEIIDEIN